jgi:hypothetical protein
MTGASRKRPQVGRCQGPAEAPLPADRVSRDRNGGRALRRWCAGHTPPAARCPLRLPRHCRGKRANAGARRMDPARRL